MSSASTTEQSTEADKCRVCSITENVRHHFGSTTCLACASFFRRAVSLNIQYICKKINKCPVSYAVRSGCRACRFQSCLNAGMNSKMIRGKREMNKCSKLVEEPMKQANETILQDNTASPPLEILALTKREEEEEVEQSSRNGEVIYLLNLTADQLLEYYMELNEKEPCPLRNIEYSIFPQINQRNKKESLFICKNCPGTDLLNQEDMDILCQYVSFCNLWLDALWDEIHTERGGGNDHLKRSNTTNLCEMVFENFVCQFQESVGDSLFRLNLDIVEFAVLKSFVIWKLGVVDFSMALKIVGQEHYLGTTRALSDYYKSEKDMGEMEIAVRIADLTLFLGPIFNSYHEMVILYDKLQGNPDFQLLASEEET